MYIHYLYKFRASESRFNTFTDRRPGTASQAPSEDCNPAPGMELASCQAVTSILNAAQEHYHQLLSNRIIPRKICIRKKKKPLKHNRFSKVWLLKDTFKPVGYDCWGLVLVVWNPENVKSWCMYWIYWNNVNSWETLFFLNDYFWRAGQIVYMYLLGNTNNLNH